MKTVIIILLSITILILSYSLFIVWPQYFSAKSFIATYKNCEGSNHGKFRFFYVKDGIKYIFNCENGLYPQFWRN